VCGQCVRYVRIRAKFNAPEQVREPQIPTHGAVHVPRLPGPTLYLTPWALVALISSVATETGGKRLLGRSRHRWQDNIKVDRTQISL
jgi:hypothetical protein